MYNCCCILGCKSYSGDSLCEHLRIKTTSIYMAELPAARKLHFQSSYRNETTSQFRPLYHVYSCLIVPCGLHSDSLLYLFECFLYKCFNIVTWRPVSMLFPEPNSSSSIWSQSAKAAMRSSPRNSRNGKRKRTKLHRKNRNISARQF